LFILQHYSAFISSFSSLNKCIAELRLRVVYFSFFKVKEIARSLMSDIFVFKKKIPLLSLVFTGKLLRLGNLWVFSQFLCSNLLSGAHKKAGVLPA